MPRVFLFVIIMVATLPNCIVAHPARPLYVPPPPPKAPVRPVLNLNGTAWLGAYLTSNRIFTFEADGTLSYKISAASKISTKNRGTWSFDGETLRFEYYINAKNKLMEFRGRFQDENTIVGESIIIRTGVSSRQSLIRAKR